MAQIFTNYIPLIYVGMITYACHKLSSHLISNWVPRDNWEIWNHFRKGSSVVPFQGEYWNIDSAAENLIYMFIVDTQEIFRKNNMVIWVCGA